MKPFALEDLAQDLSKITDVEARAAAEQIAASTANLLGRALVGVPAESVARDLAHLRSQASSLLAEEAKEVQDAILGWVQRGLTAVLRAV